MRLLAAAVTALVLAGPAAACTKHASQAALETELVCPSCHVTLDESNSPVAREMKAYIRRRIAQCATEKQILAELSSPSQFGPTVLSTPQTHGFDLLAWVLPLGGAALGAAALGACAWRWARVEPPARGATLPARGEALDLEVERRVDEELARFDG